MGPRDGRGTRYETESTLLDVVAWKYQVQTGQEHGNLTPTIHSFLSVSLEYDREVREEMKIAIAQETALNKSMLRDKGVTCDPILLLLIRD